MKECLAEWLETCAGGEPILGVVIGKNRNLTTLHPKVVERKLLAWEEAKPMLSYEFSNGFGASQCHPVHAWTKSWIIFVQVYDGAVAPVRVPRNPTENPAPELIGGE